MTALPKLMSTDEFYAWNENQPGRWELFRGVPVEMQADRVIYSQTKLRATNVFEAVIAKAGLSCHALIDGPSVRIDAHNSYRPDAMVYCGDPLPGETIVVSNPLIVVEVLSPGTAMRDVRDKFVGYFRVPSIQHYLIVDTDEQLIIHHARGEGDAVVTRVVKEGAINLNPPGLAVPLSGIFGLPEKVRP